MLQELAAQIVLGCGMDISIEGGGWLLPRVPVWLGDVEGGFVFGASWWKARWRTPDERLVGAPPISRRISSPASGDAAPPPPNAQLTGVGPGGALGGGRQAEELRMLGGSAQGRRPWSNAVLGRADRYAAGACGANRSGLRHGLLD